MFIKNQLQEATPADTALAFSLRSSEQSLVNHLENPFTFKSMLEITFILLSVQELYTGEK